MRPVHGGGHAYSEVQRSVMLHSIPNSAPGLATSGMTHHTSQPPESARRAEPGVTRCSMLTALDESSSVDQLPIFR